MQVLLLWLSIPDHFSREHQNGYSGGNSGQSGESCYNHFVLNVDKGPAWASPAPTLILSVCCVLKNTPTYTDAILFLTGAWVELFTKGLVVELWLASDSQTSSVSQVPGEIGLLFECVLPACMSVQQMHSVPRSQNRAADPLELELQAVLSY